MRNEVNADLTGIESRDAQARKSGLNKAGVIWWSTDAEKRKRRQKGASPGGS